MLVILSNVWDSRILGTLNPNHGKDKSPNGLTEVHPFHNHGHRCQLHEQTLSERDLDNLFNEGRKPKLRIQVEGK